MAINSLPNRKFVKVAYKCLWNEVGSRVRADPCPSRTASTVEIQRSI